MVVSDHQRAVGARDLPDQRGDLGRSRGRLRPGKTLLRGECCHIPGSRRRLGTLAALATPGDSGVPPTRLRPGGRTVQGEPRALPGFRGAVVDLLVPRRAGGGCALARRVPASRAAVGRGGDSARKLLSVWRPRPGRRRSAPWSVRRDFGTRLSSRIADTVDETSGGRLSWSSALAGTSRSTGPTASRSRSRWVTSRRP